MSSKAAFLSEDLNLSLIIFKLAMTFLENCCSVTVSVSVMFEPKLLFPTPLDSTKAPVSLRRTSRRFAFKGRFFATKSK